MLRLAAILLLAIVTATSGSRASPGVELEPEAVVAFLADRPDVIRDAVDRIQRARQAVAAGGAEPAPPEDPLLAYLMDNPALILEAIDRYEAARKVAAHQDALFGQPGDPVMGNPDGEIVLVEFSDYNCPYCQVMVPVLQRLLAEEPELKLIVKEMPILAETSWYAAQVALAANEQGLYREFHETMFGIGARSERVVDNVAGLVGVELDVDALAAHDARINANLGLGQDLGLDGTPSFVIGDRIFVGQVSYEELKAAIDAVRAAG